MQNSTIRSFVRREGHMTPGQKRSLEEVLPRYSLPLNAIDLQLVTSKFKKIVLDIGFGMGASLLALARENPDTLYIGIEVYRPGIGKVCMQVVAEELSNVRLYAEDALIVLAEYLPNDFLDAVLLFFPDPWPKRYHHKRRIVQPAFVALVWRALKTGGVFHMATDWNDYRTHILSVMNTAVGFSLCDIPYRPETKYHRRGERLGHGVWDFAYQKI